ncbi:MAG: hypothetical protein LBR95_00480 [Azoarcus sp.]|jgi:hypothetical protein|nr:hypothetical protein [Azoarcus sp.]
MSQLTPGASAPTEAQTLENPHCAKQWPDHIGDHVIAKLTRASSAAFVLAQILRADHRLQNEDDEADIKPFTSYFHHGLSMALHVSLNEIVRLTERLADRAISTGAQS